MEQHETNVTQQEPMDARIAKAIQDSLWIDHFKMMVVFLPGKDKVSVRMMDAADLGILLRNLQQ